MRTRRDSSRGTPFSTQSRREELLVAAAKVFREKGYNAATLQDISAELGISKAGIYNYISTKDDLLFELLSEIIESHIQNMERVQPVEASPLDKLQMLVEGHVSMILDGFAKGRCYYTSFQALPYHRSRALLAQRLSYERYVESLLTRGIEMGTVCADIDPLTAQNFILSSVNSIYLWYDTERFHWWRPAESPAAATANLPQQYGEMIASALRCSPDTHVPGHRSQLPRSL